MLDKERTTHRGIWARQRLHNLTAKTVAIDGRITAIEHRVDEGASEAWAELRVAEQKPAALLGRDPEAYREPAADALIAFNEDPLTVEDVLMLLHRAARPTSPLDP